MHSKMIRNSFMGAIHAQNVTLHEGVLRPIPSFKRTKALLSLSHFNHRRSLMILRNL